MNRLIVCIFLISFLTGCAPRAPVSTPTPQLPSATSTFPAPPTATPTVTTEPTATPRPPVPNFDHIVIIIFENKEFGTVIGNPDMPIYNKLAQDYTLLTQFYAITHPSLPNYIAMMGGDTFGIDTNCEDCFINATSLSDLVEASGRTWKTYQE